MGIKRTLTSVVTRLQTEQDPQYGTASSPCDELDLRLAPYTVTETSIGFPRQREGGRRSQSVDS